MGGAGACHPPARRQHGARAMPPASTAGMCHQTATTAGYNRRLPQRPPVQLGPSTADNKSHVRNVLTSLGY